MSEPIRVLIADDDELFRRVMRSVLATEDDIVVVAEASDGEEAIAMTTEHAPNVALMDVRMPQLTGIDATRALHEIHPTTRVLMLTVSDEQTDLFDAIMAGASGYLLKDLEPDQVPAAIRRTHGGQAVLAPAIAGKVIKVLTDAINDDHDLAPLLSSREVDVLRLLRDGLDGGQVGEKLKIPEANVHHHVHNVLSKLHTHVHLRSIVDEVRGEQVVIEER